MDFGFPSADIFTAPQNLLAEEVLALPLALSHLITNDITIL
jgi:hypothetical protein